MYFDENNNYFDDYINISFDRSNRLYSLEEWFNKGNLFKDIYSKYKNYVYKLNVSKEKYDKMSLNATMISKMYSKKKYVQTFMSVFRSIKWELQFLLLGLLVITL
jgi:hypothetical protein